MSILSFGEPMLVNYLESNKLTSVSKSYFSLGGSEVNTLVSLSDLGRETYLISTLPQNILGKEFIEVLKKAKVNTEFVNQSENEMFGSMYVKDNIVIYQRKHSAFSNLDIYQVEFTNVFNKNHEWVHLTGITPLLSNNARIIWKELLRVSIEKNIKVSIDFNYRPALGFINELWEMIKVYIDKIELFIISVDDLKKLCQLENIAIDEKSIDITLLNFCNKLKIKRGVLCVKTLNESTQLRRSVMVFENTIHTSNVKEHQPIEHIGGGDSFSGCLIDGLLNDDKITTILNNADKYVIENQNTRGNFSVEI